MKKRTKDCLTKALQKELVKIAKTRDNLRDLLEEIDMQFENANEAENLLAECIEKLSELN